MRRMDQFGRRIRLAVSALAAAFAAFADDAPPATDEVPTGGGFDFDATLSADVTSGYLLYGALMNSQPCAQGGVEAGASHAGFGRFGLGAWANSDLTGRRHTFGKAFNEDDFYLHYGRAFEIADKVSFNLRLMHMWYWYPHSTGRTRKGCPSKREIYVIGSLENPYVVPYAMWTHEWELTDGTYFECGVRRRCEVADAFSVTPAFSGNWLSHGYMTIFPAPPGEYACDDGVGCLRASVAAEYAVTEHFSVHARIDYVSIVNDEVRGAIRDARRSPYMNDFVWASIGCTYSF